MWVLDSIKNRVETETHYYAGSPSKSLLRGYAHKIVLLLSPLWLYMSFPTFSGFSLCHLMLYVLSSGSFFVMFLGSTIYHHFQHASYDQFLFWQKFDTCWVALATLCNIIPTLVFYRMYWNLLIYFVMACLALRAFTYGNVRDGLLWYGSIFLLYSICFTLPDVARNIDQLFLCPLISHLILFVIGFVLYIFPDNDMSKEGKRLIVATHDLIHLISIAYFLNFIYFNSLLHTRLCPANPSNISFLE